MIHRVGIFGGSFDPVHAGHLIIASDICDRLNLDRVHFVLSPRPPHKLALWASDTDRKNMLNAAIADDERFVLDLREFERTGPSWSVDTVTSFAAEFPDAERFFIMGEDSLADFHSWREPERILANARLAVAARPGVVLAAEHLLRFTPTDRARIHTVESPEIGISSTMVRNRIERGASIKYLVPDDVERYITLNQPYGAGPLVSQ
jgi:nicotinate-nucleotide adenylyltransferase